MNTKLHYGRLLRQLCLTLFLIPVNNSIMAQQQGVWEKYEVKERMTDVEANKQKKPQFLFSAKSDDKGMNFEMSSVWANDKKTHNLQGACGLGVDLPKGPAVLIPGELVTIKGTISNPSAEPTGSISGYAVLATGISMKPQSGKVAMKLQGPMEVPS